MYSLNRAGWYIDIKINIVIHSLLFTCATDLVFPDRSILASLAMTDGTNANARMQLLPPPPYPPPHPTASLPPPPSFSPSSICMPALVLVPSVLVIRTH